MKLGRIVKFTISGNAPVLFGKMVMEPKENEETPHQHEERCALKKVHTNSSGNVCLCADAFKRSLEWAASWRNEKLPGGAGGKATFKKRFVAGVSTVNSLFEVLKDGKPLKPEDLEIQWFAVPPDGTRGGKKRVVKAFPTLLPSWQATGELMILDQAIDDTVFESHLRTAGIFDGIGSMRKSGGNSNGSYTVESIEYRDLMV